LGESGDERASWNHGCASEVWFMTRSAMTRIPREWAASTKVRKSSTVPRSGWIWKKSEMS
jgi:hypothetical protein